MKHIDLAKIANDSYHEKTFVTIDTEVLIRYYDHCAVVSYRGTELFQGRILESLFKKKGWIDILTDARVFPWWDFDCGWCHSGFLKEAKRTLKELALHIDKKTPIYFTGHSLGASLSLFASIKMKAKGYNVKEWVGFAPAKGMLSKNEFDFKLTGYRYKNDLVPTVPRPYIHYYPMIQLKGDGDGQPDLRDHGIGLYIAALKDV